jgi:hypothetical protein
MSKLLLNLFRRSTSDRFTRNPDMERRIVELLSAT